VIYQEEGFYGSSNSFEESKNYIWERKVVPPTAELLSMPFPRVELALVPDIVAEQQLPWINADDVPALQQAREIGRQHYEGLLKDRAQDMEDGNYENVPHVVDALGTAALVVRAKQKYGEGSPQHVEANAGLWLDSNRYLAEASRKNGSVYFEEVAQKFDETREDYVSNGQPLEQIVSNGVTPATESEEISYRLIEAVEEKTYSAVRRLAKLSIDNVVVFKPATPLSDALESRLEVRVLTISECSDAAIAAHKAGSNDWHYYAPAIEKIMLRGIRFGKTEDVRYQEQLGIPGLEITRDDINELMRRRRVIRKDQYLSKAEVRNTQMINLNGENVIDLARDLDEIASQRSGKRIFLGEIIPDDQPKDYDAIPDIAAARQKKLQDDTDRLTEYLIQLEESGTDHAVGNALVGEFVDRLLFQKVKDDPEQAAIVFDERTAAGVQEVIDLRRLGKYEEAALLEQKIEYEAPPSGGCGPGSCDLLPVNLAGVEGKKIKDLLKVEPGDTVVRHKGKPCKACGKVGQVVYAYTLAKVSKGCLKCGATEFKATPGQKAA
jgi:hypothetical protein